MRKNPNPKKCLALIAPTLVSVVLCGTCLFEVPQVDAQSPQGSRASIIQQQAPKIGEVENERLYKLPYKRSLPSSGKFNIPPVPQQPAAQPAVAQSSVAKIQLDNKPKYTPEYPQPNYPQPKLRFPNSEKFEITNQSKTFAEKTAGSQATISFQDRNSQFQQTQFTNPVNNNLPRANPHQHKSAVATARIAKNVAPPVQSFAKQSFASRPNSAPRSIQAPTSDTPPTIVLRPSVMVADHENECVFEINEIESSNDVSLRVAIPDSVSIIEVVPNRNTNAMRKFRIKMDQGDLAHQQPVSKKPQQSEPPRPTPKAQPNSKAKPTLAQPTSTAQNNDFQPLVPFGPEAPAPPQAPEAPKAQQRYLKNPFFLGGDFAKPADQVAQNASSESVQEQSTDVKLSNVDKKKQVGVREFLKKISHTSSNEESTQLATQLATQALAYEDPKGKTLQHAHSLEPAIPVIAAQIVGPTEIAVGQTADFMLGIINPMDVINRDLKVELDIPRGFEIILLDQEAEFHQRTGTLYWTVNHIKPGGRARLRYRVRSTRPGSQLQRVAVRIKDDLVDDHEIRTMAKVDLSTGAGKLPLNGKPDAKPDQPRPQDSIGTQRKPADLDMDNDSKPSEVDRDTNEFPVNEFPVNEFPANNSTADEVPTSELPVNPFEAKMDQPLPNRLPFDTTGLN